MTRSAVLVLNFIKFRCATTILVFSVPKIKINALVLKMRSQTFKSFMLGKNEISLTADLLNYNDNVKFIEHFRDYTYVFS